MKRLRELRKRNGLSQAAFAEKFHASQNTVSQWESGARKPSYDTVSEIASYFGVTTDYLLGRDAADIYGSLNPPMISDVYVTYPVIGEIAAGYEHIVEENWEGDTIEIPQSVLKGHSREDFFVLRVKGDSMYPDFMDGDKVLVLKQATLNYSGQVGVIIYDGEIASLKKVEFKKGEDWLKMVAVNPAYPPRRIEGADLQLCKVIGIPKMLIREYEE